MEVEVICEHGLPVRPSEPFPVGQSPYCRPCWVAMGGTGSASPLVPCVHRGEPLAGSECVALGLSPARSWAPCGHVDQPKGIYVCPCKGCGPSCPGYSASMES